MADQKTVTFVVTGMHCGSCSGLIDDELGDVPGIITSATDAGSGRSVVTFDAAVVSVEQISAAIGDAGDFTAAAEA